MKKFIPVLILVLFQLSATAQFNVGFRVGGHSSSFSPDDLVVLNSDGIESFKIKVQGADYGIHAALVTRLQLGKIIINPEFEFNSNKIDYKLTDLRDSGLPDSLKSEKFQYLDIPFMVGVKSDFIRLEAGPVGHLYINNTSDFSVLDGFSQNFEPMTFGYRVRLGLDIWKFLIDVEYEGNLNGFGDHIAFFGNSYDFSQSPSRLMLSVGFMFGKKT